MDNKNKCQKVSCRDNKVAFREVLIPAALGDDKTGLSLPENGAYTNALVKYEANDAIYFYDSYGVFTKFSGEYDDEELRELIRKETEDRTEADQNLQDQIDAIPQANDGVLTIQRNGVAVGTFSANADTDTTVNVSVPTATSELTNDSNFATTTQVTNAVAAEATTRESADTNLQGQIDAISASSDVTDIVGTYAELQNYDTSTLGDKDIIKVLQDESRDNETTYYRWSTSTQTFTLIGEEGPYYTKSQADNTFVPQTRTVNSKALSSNISLDAADVGAIDLTDIAQTTGTSATKVMSQDATTTALAGKQDTLTPGANITISGATISAVDTTYQPFTGTDGVDPGTVGLVPAPTASDTGKYLCADGTWATVSAPSMTLYTTTGANTDGAMTQKATTNMIWPDGDTTKGVFISNNHTSMLDANTSAVAIGNGVYTGLSGGTAPANSVAIGYTARAISESVYIGANSGGSSSGADSVVIGHNAGSNSSSVVIGQGAVGNYASSVIIGRGAETRGTNSIAIGRNAKTNTGTDNISIGSEQTISGVSRSVALGRYATATRIGEVNIGFAGNTTGGYNGTAYAVLGGVHDGVNDHDAVTVGQLNAAIAGAGGGATLTDAEFNNLWENA